LIDGKFDKIDGKFEKIEDRFDKVEGKIGKLESKIENIEIAFKGETKHLKWMLGFILAFMTAVFVMYLKTLI